MVWVAFAVLVAVALVFLLWPLLHEATPIRDARSSELAVYRDQLRELDEDFARGAIAPSEAEAARTEIKRKMLAVASAVAAPSYAGRAMQAAWFGVGAGLPLLAAGIYLLLGHPGLTGRTPPIAPSMTTPATSEAPALPSIEAMITRLATRLKDKPDDAQGWRMLAQSYAFLGRFEDAGEAFERAIALDGGNAALRAEYGESVIGAADGRVTAQAEKLFGEALALDPKEPRALFFRGLALEQRGKPREALALWVKLIREGDANAEWMPALRERARALAVRLKLDPAKEVPDAGPADASAALEADAGAVRGPTAGDVEAASQLTPEAKDAMIKGMIAGLEARLQSNPNDLEGWLMLARSRVVTGDAAGARKALERARMLFGRDPQMQTRIDQASAELGLADR